MDVVTYRGLACRIRRACNFDSEAIIALYKEVRSNVPDYVTVMCTTAVSVSICFSAIMKENIPLEFF